MVCQLLRHWRGDVFKITDNNFTVSREGGSDLLLFALFWQLSDSLTTASVRTKCILTLKQKETQTLRQKKKNHWLCDSIISIFESELDQLIGLSKTPVGQQ